MQETLPEYSVSAGEEIILYKYAAVLDSLNYTHDQIVEKCKAIGPQGL